MDVRILDLDGCVIQQPRLASLQPLTVSPAQKWAPYIRLACSFGRFRRFERALDSWLGTKKDTAPCITFPGSGDFHHVSLALVRRVSQPINLLVLDNHPDWMRGVPFLHCGTWVYHAARLPMVERVFHVGGNVDFDNYYQRLVPWRLLRSGKITVLPGVRGFRRGMWCELAPQPLRPQPATAVSAARVEELLLTSRGELACRPLYISVDKDVMRQEYAVVNWDSGHLTLVDVQVVLGTFLRLAHGRLAGIDIVGDWSPVHVRGWLRHLMHGTMHPALAVEQADAVRRNERTNLALLETIRTALGLPPAAFHAAA